MAGRFLLPLASTLLPSSVHAATPVGRFILDSLFFPRRRSIFPFRAAAAARLLRSPRILFHSLSSFIMNAVSFVSRRLRVTILSFFLVPRCCTLRSPHVRIFLTPRAGYPRRDFVPRFSDYSARAGNLFSPARWPSF